MLNTAVAFLSTMPRLPSLVRENAALRMELAARQVELARLRETLRHTEEADTLHALHPGDPRAVIARVAGRSTIPIQQTVLLNRGSRHGLQVEGVVITAQGMVGRIAEANAGSALVTLLTDPSSRIAGLIERSRETGLLVGRGLGLCELLYLSVENDVVVGDHVVTAGLGGSIPKGLLLGMVVQVVRDEPTGSARALVKPAARLGQLEEVLCLPPS